MKRGKEQQGQGQQKEISPQGSLVIHPINFHDGLVFIANKPDDTLLQNLMEPDPNDPTFAALCNEIEVAMGIRIDNNPENENPSYFFDTPFEPSLDNKSQGQGQGEKSQSSEDVRTVVLEGQEQEQLTPRAQKIIPGSGLKNIRDISPIFDDEKLKVEKDVEVPAVPIYDPENLSWTVKQGEGGLNNVSIEGDDDETENVDSGTDAMIFELEDVLTELNPLPASSSRSPSKKMNLKMIDNMKEELAKSYPDMMLIKDLMKNTFVYRRKMIGISSARTIWTTFPALKYSAVIRQEYLDVSKKNIEKLAVKLDIIFDNLLDVNIGDLQTSSSLLRSALTELNNSTLLVGSFSLKRLRRNVGMLAFCTEHVGPLRHGKIFSRASQFCNTSEEVKCLTPFIVLNKGTLVGVDGETSMDIYVENTKVGSTESFYDAVLTLYMMYWVMWMEYGKSSKTIFEAFDAFLREN